MQWMCHISICNSLNYSWKCTVTYILSWKADIIIVTWSLSWIAVLRVTCSEDPERETQVTGTITRGKIRWGHWIQQGFLSPSSHDVMHACILDTSYPVAQCFSYCPNAHFACSWFCLALTHAILLTLCLMIAWWFIITISQWGWC